MPIEIKVPVLPESVADATVAAWHKKPGEFAKRDENLVDIETDKVVLEVVAPEDGVIESIAKPQGSVVKAQEVIGLFNPKASSEFKKEVLPEAKQSEPQESKSTAPEKKQSESQGSKNTAPKASPAVRRLASEQGLNAEQLTGSGKGGRVLKEDVLSVLTATENQRLEKRVPMSRLRARIAERLVEAQQTAAILTTFNEVNMQAIIDLRQKYKDIFEKTYHSRLGFMSFFVKAAIEALKRFPSVNASIDGQDMIYHGYYDIGVAVSSPRGLVVPVVRDADGLSMAQIEAKIAEYGQKAKDAQLSIEEITGGTFTISNGGVFGSLMSTPILNMPQSAILGMHKIQERPMVENGQMVIRPMMYLALSYDHRIIDGAESVRFLVTIKEQLEDPTRLILGV